MKISILALASILRVAYCSPATLLTHRSASNAAVADPLCNRRGWDAGAESILSTTEGNYPACSAACFQNSNCKSFAYTGNVWKAGDCQLYDVAVAGNFIADSSSPYSFYDIGCEKTQKVCNKNGIWIGKDEDVTWAADTYSSPPAEQAYSYCYNECKSDLYCKSFSWNKVSCIFYDVPLSGNFYESLRGDTSIFFYDLSCGDSSSISSIKTSSKTSTRSTTSAIVKTTATVKTTSAFTSTTGTTTAKTSTAQNTTNIKTTVSSRTTTTLKAATTANSYCETQPRV